MNNKGYMIYNIYDRDELLVFTGDIYECMEFLGCISKRKFYRYAHNNKLYGNKYCIFRIAYEEDLEEDKE